MCYTGDVLVRYGFLMPFDVLWGGISLSSSGIMRVTHWGGCLGACPGWNCMSPCGPRLVLYLGYAPS